MIMKRLEKAKVLLEDGYKIVNLEIEDGRFTKIEECKDVINEKQDKLILPGFFDIHTHGANGKDFTTVNSIEEIETILSFYEAHGVTSVFPTLLTEHDELIFKQLELIYLASLKHKIIKGIHLEGPFLSKKYKGAQLEECLQLPSIKKCDEFIKHSHGLFSYMTLAPELEGSEEVIEYLTSKGIKVTLGHSDASFDDVRKAREKGSKCFTHLFNAMKPLNHHDPSIVMGALYYKDMYSELILDGAHLHKEVVEFTRSIKGNDKVIGITDSLMCAGLPDGEYKIGNTPIIVKGKDALIKGTSTRAGSTLNMLEAFKNIKEFSHLDDLEASKICSLNAARMLNMDSKIGSIKEGKNADFIVLDNNYNVKETYINGEKVY